MGFLRGALVTVIGVALLISLFILNATLTLTWSLEYETLKPTIKDVAGGVALEQFGLEEYVNDATLLMQEYCRNETEFVFNQEGMTFVIPCETINQGSEAIISYTTEKLVEEVYYTEYDCEFWDCVKKTDNFLVLISEKAYNYWRGKFLIFFLISIALFLLMFVVANRKSNAFILAGLVTMVSSLPFIKLTWIARFLPESLREIFLSFFTRSHNVFIIMMIVGLFLLGLGVVFHFLKWGLKISELFRKHAEEQDDLDKEDVKKIVKKEMAKDKIKKTVKKEIAESKTKPEKIVSKGEVKKVSVKPVKSVKPAKPVMKSNKNNPLGKVSKV
jgi:uncharacterized membrane protein